MSFELLPLPYEYDALVPAIDAQTMEIHYGKHHAAYTNNLNALLEENEVVTDLSIEEILANISRYPAGIRNNAGGYYNHNLFWSCMCQGGQEMSDGLRERLTEQFSGLETFLTAFEDAATKRFGSGWAWLGVNTDGEMKVFSTANQDNPLMDVVIETEGAYVPVLCLDVWEHAYYLHYQNRRPDYIKNWWSVVDWDAVEQRINAVLGE